MKNYRLRKFLKGSTKITAQWGFNKCRLKIQIMGGAFGNGKTTAVCIKAAQLVTDYPGCVGLMVRATYPKLNDTLRKAFLSWIPPHWVKKWPTQEDNSVYFHNGSVVHFRYVAQKGKSQEDGSTTSNLLSAAYDWIVGDQFEDPEIVYKDFLDLLGRLRGETPYRPVGEDDPTMPRTGPRWLMITLNPTRNWMFHKVVNPLLRFNEDGTRLPDLIVDPVTHEPIIALFESDVYENKDNLPADYIMGLEASYKGQMFERYVAGKWVAFEGLVHPSFDPRRHVLSRFQMEAHLNDCLAHHVKVKVMECYDFGLVSPTCYMLAFVDELGRVCILDGFYEPEFDYTEHPAAIREIRSKYMGLLQVKEPILADPSIFRRTVVKGGVSGDTVSKLLSELGIQTRAAMNDIAPGIAKMNSYLNGHPYVPHITTLERPGPLLYVCADMLWFQTEITAYYWKKSPLGATTDEPTDHNDHAMNACKYLLSKLPETSKIVLPNKERRKQYMFWHEMETKDYANAQRRH